MFSPILLLAIQKNMLPGGIDAFIPLCKRQAGRYNPAYNYRPAACRIYLKVRFSFFCSGFVLVLSWSSFGFVLDL